VVNGLSAAEAAELLGIDVKKVYADKFRVLARLREELRDLWLE
jgi:DNA-directed RNA polymerase specialized sigma24 family protein